MKKILAVLMCSLMILGISACGKKANTEISHKDDKEIIELMDENGYELKNRYDNENQCTEVYFKNEKTGNAFSLNEKVENEYYGTIIFQYNSKDMILIGQDIVAIGNEPYKNTYHKYTDELKRLDLLEEDLLDLLQGELTKAITTEESNKEAVEKEEKDKKISTYLEKLDNNEVASKIKNNGYEYVYDINSPLGDTRFEKKTKSDNDVDLYYNIDPKKALFTISDGSEKREYYYQTQLGYSKYCVLDFTNGRYDTTNSLFISKTECRPYAENMNFLKSVFEKELNLIGLSIDDLNNFANALE
ncbi:hypothetical protein ACWG0P_07340 [Amedibacillus sp. YH-ame6]